MRLEDLERLTECGPVIISESVVSAPNPPRAYTSVLGTRTERVRNEVGKLGEKSFKGAYTSKTETAEPMRRLTGSSCAVLEGAIVADELEWGGAKERREAKVPKRGWQLRREKKKGGVNLQPD